MGEKMSLSAVLRCLRSEQAYCKQEGLIREGWYEALADGVEAHLATPTQTVDIEAVSEVIAQLKYLGKANSDQLEEWADKLSQAIGDKT